MKSCVYIELLGSSHCRETGFCGGVSCLKSATQSSGSSVPPRQRLSIVKEINLQSAACEWGTRKVSKKNNDAAGLKKFKEQS